MEARSQLSSGVRPITKFMFEFEEAQFRLGWLPGEALPDVAVRMLEAGFDSQAVREVAGMDRPTLRDASERFADALDTLGRAPMTAADALTWVRQSALEELADPASDVERGLRFMHYVWVADDCSLELAIFVGLEDEWYDHPHERAAVEADVRETARSLLSGQKPRRAG